MNSDTEQKVQEQTVDSEQEVIAVTSTTAGNDTSDYGKGAEQRLTGFESSVTGLKYYLSLPKGYNADGAEKWPLILFLHGSGDRGDDLELIKRSGITNIAEKDGLKFIAVYPQCPDNSEWEEMTATISDFLDELTGSLRVDEGRVYITGFSMGGYGTWYMALEYPDRFAAIAPVCGSIFEQDVNQENADSLRNLPIWAFHGGKDTIVPPEVEKNFVELIQKAGGNVKYTAYDDLGHDIWVQAYNDELYDWLLQQKR
ncbi:MAG TPA: dienelactone hydrolase family protein [Clostridia bacterium]|nr:dienelactone hydrolase family protein [Clostridia bacterium]